MESNPYKTEIREKFIFVTKILDTLKKHREEKQAEVEIRKKYKSLVASLGFIELKGTLPLEGKLTVNKQLQRIGATIRRAEEGERLNIPVSVYERIEAMRKWERETGEKLFESYLVSQKTVYDETSGTYKPYEAAYGLVPVSNTSESAIPYCIGMWER